ncbi:MAG: ATP-dependent DNA ligase [Acidimicrobiia bacterium]|nr:ATP-dependent DNA ligase [Acidimicrobiia bacterium]NNF89431.1 ATP-dependent DNA ligase [Acidimicrobiia bacterium]NNJ47647.1 ATP-dependent DNA ligase [Acidimicrobiia bacterium]NNL13688.1 ATP-dependent DNA ligase [Acidimicrobiia bacterium]RZV43459.1 MAG: ATP-dependent DNA ligase [Acidimicrobiia bacterium]
MSSWPFSPPIATMEARVKVKPPEPPGWRYEPKWDGFRAVSWSDEPRLDSRNQKPLLRYFPELVPALQQLPPGTVVDGEVVVVLDDRTSFDALQLRIHPAESRITRLAAEIPASLVAFDLLAVEGNDLRNESFANRRSHLEQLFGSLDEPWHLTPSTDDLVVARGWFDSFEAAGCDGIVCKNADAPYVEGKREMIKWKHRRSVDCVVGGYREHKDGGKIGSLLLGLYNADGDLHFIGHCSGFSDHDRVELLKQFEQLRSDESFGFEARMPGADSRWSAGKDLAWTPVQPGVVVQVSYDQLTENRFRHATRLERWRPDKDAEDCTLDQLERPEGPGFAEVVGS